MDGRANHGRIGAKVTCARGAVARVMPWGLSLLLHVGVAAVAALVAVTVVPARARPLTASGAILAAQAQRPIATVSRAGEVGVSGVSMDAPHQAARGVERIRAAPAAAVPLDLAGLDSACGAGAFSAAFRAPPRSSLLGAGGNAHHVVYVIDCSGSMIGLFDEVRRAVLLSIGRLNEDQDFHVILFTQGRAIENAPQRLVAPSEVNKLQAAEFLASARAAAQSDPIPALRRAFEVLADAGDGGKLIYLLSDGVFPDGPAVLATIHARNRDKDVHINTYGCGGDPVGAALLERVARETGGLFRPVDAGAPRP
jgi:Mg-chelatase subunit ChlD